MSLVVSRVELLVGLLSTALLLNQPTSNYLLKFGNVLSSAEFVKLTLANVRCFKRGLGDSCRSAEGSSLADFGNGITAFIE